MNTNSNSTVRSLDEQWIMLIRYCGWSTIQGEYNSACYPGCLGNLARHLSRNAFHNSYRCNFELQLSIGKIMSRSQKSISKSTIYKFNEWLKVSGKLENEQSLFVTNMYKSLMI